ncbi:C2H2 C2HC zinc finger [Fusarium heterosporum]|uniref:C2H2 C2HC zinc finger n=1 Tax=Fusarium heterosporum TaxID=42747 RepID=A0A8H5WQ19_FUSHE|nr:C2H2 C2HC zinc finger [Fusarium heterosporum]
MAGSNATLPASEPPSISAWDTSKALIRNRFKDEAKRFEHISLRDLLRDLNQLEGYSTTKDSRNPFVNTFENFILALSNYGRALDTFAQVDTLLFTPIWGSIRVIIQAVVNFRDYTDRLLQMVRDLTDNLPRFDEYGELFRSEMRVQSALEKIFCDAFEFCIAARNVFAYERNSGRRCATVNFYILELLANGSILGLPRPLRDPAIKSLWKNFELQYGTIVASFKHNSALLEHETQASGLKTASHFFHSTHAKLDDIKRLNSSNLDAYNRECAYATWPNIVLTPKSVYRERSTFAWLNAPSLNEQLYNRYSQYCLPNTCQWIFQRAEFVKHLNKHPGVGATLWLTGIPGSGKSVLCSHVVTYLKNIIQKNVAYCFCSKMDTRMGQPDSVCRTLVSQLLLQDKNKARIWDLVSRVMERRRDLQVASEELVWSLLFQICRAQPTDIVIDGFDECSDGRILLDHVTSLGSVARVTIFSRKTELLIPEKLGAESIEISRTDVDADIDFMIRSSLASCALASVLDQQKLDDVREKILRRSGGVFIWAKLSIDELCQLQTMREIDRSIEAYPEGVSAMYLEAIKRFSKLPARQRNRVLDLLGWVTVACRSLTLKEIEDALVITPSTDQISENDRILSIRSVLDQCRPLIDVDPRSAEVRYCHYSLKELILGLSRTDALNFGFDFTWGSDGPLGPQLSSRIGLLCLRYLQMKTLRRDWIDGNSSEVLSKKYPLFEYAILHWLGHMLDGKPDLLSVQEIRSFMISDIASKWLQELIRVYEGELGHYHYGPLIMALERRLNDWKAVVLPVTDRVTEVSGTNNPHGFQHLLENRAIQQSITHGAKDPRAIEAYRTLYLHHSWRGDLSKAEGILRQILESFGEEKSPSCKGTQVILFDVLFDLSQVEVSQGKLEDAREAIYQVYEGHKSLLGEDSFEVAKAAGALADILADMDRQEEAEPLHKHALSILIHLRGERSLDTAFQYNNLGNCLCQLGKLEEAEICLQKALRCRQATLGSRSQSALRSLDCLGVVLQKKNDLEGAYQAHAAAFKDLQDVVGTSHFFTWRAAGNLARVKHRLGYPMEALALALKALENLEVILGPSALDTISAADLVAELVYGQDRDLSLSLIIVAKEKAIAIQRPYPSRIECKEILKFLWVSCYGWISADNDSKVSPGANCNFMKNSMEVIEKKEHGEKASGDIRIRNL